MSEWRHNVRSSASHRYVIRAIPEKEFAVNR